ncbi:MAG TPA: hypothetical protein VFM90_10900, partial [Cyclobacteriaceae bacterium]|nr:hypothetical protein [Cyclobacteriaceae bacterium]
IKKYLHAQKGFAYFQHVSFPPLFFRNTKRALPDTTTTEVALRKTSPKSQLLENICGKYIPQYAVPSRTLAVKN